MFRINTIKNFIFLFFPLRIFYRGEGGRGRKWFTRIRESIHSLLECSKSQIVICQLWIIIQGWNILFMMHESSVPLIQRKCCHTSWQFKATGNRSKLHKVCRIHTLVDRISNSNTRCEPCNPTISGRCYGVWSSSLMYMYIFVVSAHLISFIDHAFITWQRGYT